MEELDFELDIAKSNWKEGQPVAYGSVSSFHPSINKHSPALSAVDEMLQEAGVAGSKEYRHQIYTLAKDIETADANDDPKRKISRTIASIKGGRAVQVIAAGILTLHPWLFTEYLKTCHNSGSSPPELKTAAENLAEDDPFVNIFREYPLIIGSLMSELRITLKQRLGLASPPNKGDTPPNGTPGIPSSQKKYIAAFASSSELKEVVEFLRTKPIEGLDERILNTVLRGEWECKADLDSALEHHVLVPAYTEAVLNNFPNLSTTDGLDRNVFRGAHQIFRAQTPLITELSFKSIFDINQIFRIGHFSAIQTAVSELYGHVPGHILFLPPDTLRLAAVGIHRYMSAGGNLVDILLQDYKEITLAIRREVRKRMSMALTKARSNVS